MAKKRRPLKWLEEASPEEIGEALISIGGEKALRVVAYIASRAGPEAAHRIEMAVAKAQRDPAETLVRAAGAGLRSFLGGG